MTNVTEDLDRLDKAVLALYRAMLTSTWEQSLPDLPEHKVFAEVWKRAYEQAAADTGRTVQSLIDDPDVVPLSVLTKLYVQACDRQRTILAGRMDRYLDSRAFETDEAHAIRLASPLLAAGTA